MPTGISYVDETLNPIVGCSRRSPGCERCYAERVAARGMCEQHRGLTDEQGRWTGTVRLVPEALSKLTRWRKPRRIMLPSMGDLFHHHVGNAFIGKVFTALAGAPQHTVLIPTKRIERASDYLEQNEYLGTLPNVLIGASIENQEMADKRCKAIARIATLGWRVWLSVEPLLGPVDLCHTEHVNPNAGKLDVLRGGMWTQGWGFVNHSDMRGGVEFVAVGAETGPSARPCDVEWIRKVVRDCQEANVRVHVKQLSSRDSDPHGWPEDLRVRELPARRRP